MKRVKILQYLALSALLAVLSNCQDSSSKQSINDEYIVATYYWPAYHYEPRAEFLFPDKKGEWEIIYNAESKEDGHRQPNVPLWGYLNEADADDMNKKIEAAVEYGVNTFIFDWYWFEGEPFLESCINDGFLKANDGRLNFYLMWANHDATTYWDVENPKIDSVIWSGGVDREQFDIVVERVIEQYFKNPSYLKIDGEPLFSIYELNTLINGLGGAEETKDALDHFRKRTVEEGFPGLHLQSILWSALPNSIEGVPGDTIESQTEVLEYFGFKSLTNYCWAHLVNPYGDYEEWGDASTDMWNDFHNDFSMTYFPNVTVSWDANPRFKYFTAGYISNSTPQKLEKYLRKAKEHIDSHNIEPKIVTINAWNEWSEGAYLEPDTVWEYQYLDAVKNVFGNLE